MNPLVEWEPSGMNHDDDDAEGNEFNDLNDIISTSNELSYEQETFEDEHLEFDPKFPPMEKWMRDHPKEQITGDCSLGVLTWA